MRLGWCHDDDDADDDAGGGGDDDDDDDESLHEWSIRNILQLQEKWHISRNLSVVFSRFGVPGNRNSSAKRFILTSARTLRSSASPLAKKKA